MKFRYEHVAYCLLMKRNSKQVRTFEEYVGAWRDGAEWKRFFITRNPGSVYVEVENYYVKMLTGWKGPEPVNETDLVRAKDILKYFHIIIITDWIKHPRNLSSLPAISTNPSMEILSLLQVEMMNSLFPVKDVFSSQRKLEGYKSLRQNTTIFNILAVNHVSLCRWHDYQVLILYCRINW